MTQQLQESNQLESNHRSTTSSVFQSNSMMRVDGKAFHPNQIMSFEHDYTDHPLLKLPALIEFAKYMEPIGGIRYHGDHAKADTHFETAPQTHATGLTIQETLTHIENSQSWVAFHHVERHPEYKKLVDDCLNQVQGLAELHERRTFRRSGWVFVASPGTITPYHMDHEHNFLMQIQGEKQIHVWDSKDRSIVTDLALENFHAKRSLSLVRYKPELQAKANTFHVLPGNGVYMPSTSPHMVQNGKGVSITFSVTYISEFTQRAAIVHTVNHMLRLRGHTPTPYGKSQWRDSIKSEIFGSYLKKKGRILT